MATYGNYLTEADAAAGRNFLTPDIQHYATERIAAGGGVEEFRCTRNLLSSQPMAFKLFGPLHVGVAPNTVARAYRELERDGFVQSRGRRGTRVLPVPTERPASAAVRIIDEAVSTARSHGSDGPSILGLVAQSIART